MLQELLDQATRNLRWAELALASAAGADTGTALAELHRACGYLATAYQCRAGWPDAREVRDLYLLAAVNRGSLELLGYLDEDELDQVRQVADDALELARRLEAKRRETGRRTLIEQYEDLLRAKEGGA